mgnify:CR=1 FL=1
MKNLKNTLKIMLVLLVFISTSCKKEDTTSTPEQDVNPVASKDLLDYYIVAEHKTGASKLMVAYFEQIGDKVVVKATRQGRPDYIGVTVDHEANVTKGLFSIDWNGDGRTAMYHFTIEKDANGNLKLKTYDFVHNAEGNLLAYAVLAKKTEALPFEDRNFKMAASGLPFETVKNGIPVNFLKFLGNKIMYWPTRCAVYQIDPYDPILNIGFRTKSLVLGVTVPYWNGVNTPVMLFEMEDLLFMAAIQ